MAFEKASDVANGIGVADETDAIWSTPWRIPNPISAMSFFVRGEVRVGPQQN